MSTLAQLDHAGRDVRMCADKHDSRIAVLVERIEKLEERLNRLTVNVAQDGIDIDALEHRLGALLG